MQRWLSLSLPTPNRRRERAASRFGVLACDDGYMRLLTDDEITAGLGRAVGWERAGDQITKTIKLADFSHAMLYVGAVAHLAEVANHHPDIEICWNRVTLTLSTHSAGGLTEADFLLATQLNALP